ncbi:ribulose-phosphate 3-epimerase [Candidatus Woesearchaeota archaeon]|nr:ribulose-phosphate 3-epimerase [Candidatus Woesearchaeota archaeon]MBI2130537.1 ribulose-phosphate 3-epimerase [Candidatus Woesearchaeota archaeon]
MPKIKIAPSILSADWNHINKEIKEVKPYCGLIHVDIMDGIFVPNKTIDSKFVKKITTKVPLDVHLMVQEPSEEYILDFINAGGSIITLHQEAYGSIGELREKLNFIKANGAKPSVAIRPKTPLNSIKDVLDIVDMVLIMTVEPGMAGQKFMPEPINKVRELRKINPNIDIEVDGGISPETIGIAAKAGANVFVAGSSIFGRTDRITAIKELKRNI